MGHVHASLRGKTLFTYIRHRRKLPGKAKIMMKMRSQPSQRNIRPILDPWSCALDLWSSGKPWGEPRTFNTYISLCLKRDSFEHQKNPWGEPTAFTTYISLCLKRGSFEHKKRTMGGSQGPLPLISRCAWKGFIRTSGKPWGEPRTFNTYISVCLKRDSFEHPKHMGGAKGLWHLYLVVLERDSIESSPKKPWGS